MAGFARWVVPQSEILSEVYVMFFVGIGKNNHVASMMDESGKVVFKAFSFPDTSDGGESLFSKLSSYSSDTASFEVGMEATGQFYFPA